MADQEQAANKPQAPAAAAPIPPTTPAPAAPAVVASKPVEHEVTLTHFGLKLSKEAGRNVELVHGFIHTEEKAKRYKDTEANYRARYKEFLTAEPV